jgi:hypothetical protein
MGQLGNYDLNRKIRRTCEKGTPIPVQCDCGGYDEIGVLSAVPWARFRAHSTTIGGAMCFSLFKNMVNRAQHWRRS